VILDCGLRIAELKPKVQNPTGSEGCAKSEYRISKFETISKSEYQMTKTFPALLQYLFETFEDILCFEFGTWVIRICFGFRASSFGFTKN